ncbi:hypothetical protein BVER_01657 [Candidatus Burkholderia verschuerenii]|uniref:Integral membrane protein n=1 Tax=Candidatus Burkholderia verschuerenii TaxID=242163 RepID=A0A0L0MJD3_9BURK|nr:DUF2269 domain-containing protein [Candidatus Burkholderia verschuerenii]KND62448.1 hypothetical protein BVER_01657 [Candidatus Burkholderia verschuerenii]
MNSYLLLKWLHVLVSTILFGTGIGIAFFKWVTDRTGDVRAIRIVMERTVMADWIFTTPAVILQPLTGVGLARLAGYDMFDGWVLYAIALYAFAGCCWIPVVWLQIRMREIARNADAARSPLPREYWRHASVWFWLGIPAFTALVGVYWLMVLKPTI